MALIRKIQPIKALLISFERLIHNFFLYLKISIPVLLLAKATAIICMLIYYKHVPGSGLEVSANFPDWLYRLLYVPFSALIYLKILDHILFQHRPTFSLASLSEPAYFLCCLIFAILIFWDEFLGFARMKLSAHFVISLTDATYFTGLYHSMTFLKYAFNAIATLFLTLGLLLYLQSNKLSLVNLWDLMQGNILRLFVTVLAFLLLADWFYIVYQNILGLAGFEPLYSSNLMNEFEVISAELQSFLFWFIAEFIVLAWDALLFGLLFSTIQKNYN